MKLSKHSSLGCNPAELREFAQAGIFRQLQYKKYNEENIMER